MLVKPLAQRVTDGIHDRRFLGAALAYHAQIELDKLPPGRTYLNRDTPNEDRRGRTKDRTGHIVKRSRHRISNVLRLTGTVFGQILDRKGWADILGQFGPLLIRELIGIL